MAAVPEISVRELAARLRSQDEFVVLDVREQFEIEAVSIDDPRVIVLPLSEIARLGLKGLPAPVQARETPVLVLCHHGTRSAQVASWLVASGWTHAFSVAGGIDAYAREVDPSVGLY